MKQSVTFYVICIFSFFSSVAYAMEGGRVEGGMAREGMGFHQYHGGFHRSDGGYGYGRAYGAFGRHFGRYGHRGYDKHGSVGYARAEANPADNIVARPSSNQRVKPVAKEHRDNFYTRSNGNSLETRARTVHAMESKARGGQYWGYYSPHYQYGLYPWYNNGDPYYYYQRADYYPWYWGFNPAWLWW